MRRLLIIGASAPNALETFYAKAFRSLGVDVTQLNPELALEKHVRRSRVLNRLSWNLQHHVVSRSIERFFEKDARWDAVFVVKGLFLSVRAVRFARSRTPGALWLCFDPDSPFDSGRAASSRHIRATIPLYDLYLIWSKSLLAPLTRAGAQRVQYLPFGHDPEEHFPSPTLDPSLANVVTFVGTYDKQRAQVLTSLADLPIRVYGGGWEKLGPFSALRRAVVPGSLFGPPLRTVISSSLASINILRPQNEGSHNMRTFEVPAMAGLMLTNRTAEQNDLFPEHHASLMYDTLDELRGCIEALTQRRIAAEPIKQRALEISRQHTYARRAQQIIEAVERAQSGATDAR